MKKIIISSEVLTKALSKISHAVLKNPILPMIKNIHCTATPGKLEMTATDLEVTIRLVCDCEYKQESFTFLVPFELLSKIVRLNKNCPLTITETKKGIKISGDTDVFE